MNPIQRKTNPSLSLEPTAPRSTPREGASFRDVIGGSAATLVRGAESALHRLPGGPILAAAVRASPSAPSPATPPGASVGAAALASPAPPVSGASTGSAEGPGAPGGPTTGASLEGALAASQDMNLYFLQIQEAMAAENRAYSACSNVLKARHDTVKNAIGNIRLPPSGGRPMSIDRIGKGPGIPPSTPPTTSPAGVASRPFEVGGAAPTAVGGAGALSPAEQVRRGDLTLDAYLDLRVREATSHLEGRLGPGDLGRIQRALRAQMVEDPALREMIQSATGKLPPSDG